MKENFTTRPYKNDTALTGKNLKKAIKYLKDMQERTWRVINRYTYKGKGRPKKSDYREMTAWEISRMHADIRMAKLFNGAFKTSYVFKGKPLCAQKHYIDKTITS